MKHIYKPTRIPKFGSVKWQEAMEKTVFHKLKRRESLSPQERVYVSVQREHNLRLVKKVK